MDFRLAKCCRISLFCVSLKEREAAFRAVSELSGGAMSLLTFFSFALLTSTKNACILSEGTLTDGRPVICALMVDREGGLAIGAWRGLMGASTGGACLRSAALAASKNDSVEAPENACFWRLMLATVTG